MVEYILIYLIIGFIVSSIAILVGVSRGEELIDINPSGVIVLTLFWFAIVFGVIVQGIVNIYERWRDV